MAGMTSASMIPTIVTFLMMVMVIAMYIRIISQIACKQCVHCIISTSADTAEKTNACLRKCILCTAADAGFPLYSELPVLYLLLTVPDPRDALARNCTL